MIYPIPIPIDDFLAEYSRYTEHTYYSTTEPMGVYTVIETALLKSILCYLWYSNGEGVTWENVLELLQCAMSETDIEFCVSNVLSREMNAYKEKLLEQYGTELYARSQDEWIVVANYDAWRRAKFGDRHNIAVCCYLKILDLAPGLDWSPWCPFQYAEFNVREREENMFDSKNDESYPLKAEAYVRACLSLYPAAAHPYIAHRADSYDYLLRDVFGYDCLKKVQEPDKYDYLEDENLDKLLYRTFDSLVKELNKKKLKNDYVPEVCEPLKHLWKRSKREVPKHVLQSTIKRFLKHDLMNRVQQIKFEDYYAYGIHPSDKS